MKMLYAIRFSGVLLFALASCAPSKEEQAIADYEQVVDLDVISLDKAGTLTAKDSVVILSKMRDSIGYIKMQAMFKTMERSIGLIGTQGYRVIMARTAAGKKEAQDILDVYESILEQEKKDLSFYQRKVYDSTDLRGLNYRLKLYESKPDSVLADKYRCSFADGNKKITKTYYIKNDKVVYAK